MHLLVLVISTHLYLINLEFLSNYLMNNRLKVKLITIRSYNIKFNFIK